MKKGILSIGFALLAFGSLFFSTPAVAQYVSSTFPSFRLSGITNIEPFSAIANLAYDPLNSEQSIFGNSSKLYIQYTDQITGDTWSTAFVTGDTGSRSYAFRMDGLIPDRNYAAVGVMVYKGMTYETQPKYFKTTSLVPVPLTGGPTGSPTPVTEPLFNFPTFSSVFGGKGKATTGIKDKIMTGGVTTKNGVTIAITNEQARVDARDTFVYTVNYFNDREVSLQDAKITIILPKVYEFVRSSHDFNYNTEDNRLSLPIGRIAPKTTKAYTFTARALRGGRGQVGAEAILSFAGDEISGTDHDSFHGGSKSIFGSSSLGAGFFPQTLIGWILIIIVIAFLIIAVRRYLIPAKKLDLGDKK